MKGKRSKLPPKAKHCIIAFAVLAAAYIVLRPVYLAYQRKDFAESCYGAREYAAARYEALVDERAAAGISRDDIDDRALIAQAFKEIYGADVTEDLTVPDLCRAGGVMQITIGDDDAHKLTITCSVPGHDPYVVH